MRNGCSGSFDADLPMSSRTGSTGSLRGWSLATVVLAFAMTAGLCLAFARWTSSSWLAFPRFLFALFLLFVLPGSLLVRWWRLVSSPIEQLTLATVLGMIVTCSGYVIAAWWGQPQVLWLWIAAGALSLIGWGSASRRNLWSRLRRLERSHALLLLALTGGWLPLATLSYYYRNLSRAGLGTLTFVDLSDILLHASVAAELTHTVPPQVPFLAGERLNYHIGMDLVAAVLNRYGGVPLPDLLVRFCPTLFITVGMLAAFCLARRVIGTGAAAAAAALLAVLGEDLSFIPGLLRNSPGIWCVEYFQAPTVFSQYSLNPMVMALGLLFAALFCLHRSLEDRHWGWIAAASLCTAALMQTKVFAFVHLTLAIGVVLAVHLAVFRRPEFLRQSVGIILASLPFLLLMAVAQRDNGQFVWIVSSGLKTYVKVAFEHARWPLLAIYPALGLAAYLALTFGFRSAGAVALFKALRPQQARPFPLLLAVFVALGPLLTLSTKVVPRENPGYYDNAIWFLVQSKYVGTILAVGALAGLWRRVGRPARAAMVVVVGVAGLASTGQFLVKMPKLYPLRVLSASEVETVGFLDRVARPGDVVFSPIDRPLLTLTRLRSPYHPTDFEASFANGRALAARRQDVKEFWKSWERGMLNEPLLLKYRASWVVAPNPECGGLPCGGPPSSRLTPAFANLDFTVYRVN